MNFFERYLTAWVGLCIVVGIALGQWQPELFQAIGQLEYAQVTQKDGTVRKIKPE